MTIRQYSPQQSQEAHSQAGRGQVPSSTPSESTTSMATADLAKQSLKLFAPMNVLSSKHLTTLAQGVVQRVLLSGQSLLSSELMLNDGCGNFTDPHVFLVSGELQVQILAEAETVNVDFIAGHSHSLLSLQDSFADWVQAAAKSDCQILIVDRARLDAMLCWDQAAKAMATELSADRDNDEDSLWLQTLLESNLFHKLPPYNIREVIDRFQAHVVLAGEVIVEQGEQGEYCYILKGGHAHVSRKTIESFAIALESSSNVEIKPVRFSSAECGAAAEVNVPENGQETIAVLRAGSCTVK